MRHRNMYYRTGQPGWMRLGYSPGWVGRSASGLGPCAHFLMTGRFPAQQGQVGAPFVGAAPGWQVMDAQARLESLKNQASALEQNLAAVKAQIADLEGGDQ